MNFNSLIPKRYIERELEENVFKFLNDREILVIRGPRQSGKSTLLYKIGTILQKKYGEDNVVYVNFEDELEQDKFEKDPKEYLEFYFKVRKKTFFLLDEYHYIQKGGKILKLLFDSYSQAKFIISGSSSLDISRVGGYLVGRAVFFELFPFSFPEFLKAKDGRIFRQYQRKRFQIDKPREVQSLWLGSLNKLLYEYLSFGGYPRVVLEKDKEKKKILLKNIFSTYVEKDIIKLYGLKYKDRVVQILKYLSTGVGSLLNYQDIGQITSLYFEELKELLHILEETYVIKRVYPYYRNIITELKKNPKVYFYDLGLRNIVLDRFDFSDEELGRLLENYIFIILKSESLGFWRTTAKAEVDFVLKDKVIPIEVKKNPKISRSLLSFISAYHPEIAVIACWNSTSLIRRNKTNIFTIPLSLI